MARPTETARLVVLDPTIGPEAAGLVSAPRLDNLEGKTAGLLDNSKPNADKVLDRVGAVLERRYGVASVVTARKKDASTVAELEILDDLVRRCHFVVTGVGD